jgi:hypothetical protein
MAAVSVEVMLCFSLIHSRYNSPNFKTRFVGHRMLLQLCLTAYWQKLVFIVCPYMCALVNADHSYRCDFYE